MSSTLVLNPDNTCPVCGVKAELYRSPIDYAHCPRCWRGFVWSTRQWVPNSMWDGPYTRCVPIAEHHQGYPA
jgi:hypothetical protein